MVEYAKHRLFGFTLDCRRFAVGQRYAYWRMPTGKPCKKNSTQYAPTSILNAFASDASVSKDGALSFQGLRTMPMRLPLRIAIVVLDPNSDEELNEQDSWTIGWSGVKDVIVETGGRCPLNPEAILKAADERAAVHFRRQEAKYVLVTGVSIAEFPRKKICIRGCVVSGLQSRGHRYRYPEDVKGRLGKSPIVTHVAETEYKVVKVTTTGRTGHEAVERALARIFHEAT